MGEKWSQIYKTLPLVRHKKINRRMHRKLMSSCRYCSGYEEKIIKKGMDPIHKAIAEMEKHEVIAHIASKMGDSPRFLTDAEKIFDEIKYSVTEYVLKHEFNEENSLSVQVALWLEKRKEPDLYKPLEFVINKYLKPEKNP